MSKEPKVTQEFVDATLKGKPNRIIDIYEEVYHAALQTKGYASKPVGRKEEIKEEAAAEGLKAAVEAIHTEEHFYNQVIEAGYSEEEAQKQSVNKTLTYLGQKDFDDIRARAPTKRYFLKTLEDAINDSPGKPFTSWNDLDAKEQVDILWNVGIQASKFGVHVLVGCFREDDDSPKMTCGTYVAGVERVDDGWTKLKRSDGTYVASDEARFNDHIGDFHRLQNSGGGVQWDEATLGSSNLNAGAKEAGIDE